MAQHREPCVIQALTQLLMSVDELHMGSMPVATHKQLIVDM